jgi:hypothetical protein
MKTLKELVREKVESGVTDARRVYDSIHESLPRESNRYSWEAVRRCVRQVRGEFRCPDGRGEETVAEGHAGRPMRKEHVHVHLECRHDIFATAFEPVGGRYVCNIALETADARIEITNMHCDVAETLRDALTRVIRRFARGHTGHC